MDTKSFEGEAKIWIVFPGSMPGCRASFPASNSDSAYSVPAPPAHPAHFNSPATEDMQSSKTQARVNSAQPEAMRGFVGLTAADPTPWLALQINLSVWDRLCSRVSLLLLQVLAQSHEQAYEMEMAALGEV